MTTDVFDLVSSVKATLPPQLLFYRQMSCEQLTAHLDFCFPKSLNWHTSRDHIVAALVVSAEG